MSVGYDLALAGCAGATGCTYLAVADVAGLAGLDHLAGRVRLLVLRWPPAGNGGGLALTFVVLLIGSNADFVKKPVTDPFVQEAMRVFPGLAPGDSMRLNDGKTQLSIQSAAAGIRALYEDMLNRAWTEAKARGEKLPDPMQKDIPPTVPGQQ